MPNYTSVTLKKFEQWKDKALASFVEGTQSCEQVAIRFKLSPKLFKEYLESKGISPKIQTKVTLERLKRCEAAYKANRSGTYFALACTVYGVGPNTLKKYCKERGLELIIEKEPTKRQFNQLYAAKESVT